MQFLRTDMNEKVVIVVKQVQRKRPQVMYVTMVPFHGNFETASPRGRYGERLQRDSCLKHTI